MGKTLQISSDLLGKIVAHAERAPRLEVCGLLLGTPDRIELAEPCANVADDPATRFEIDPAALLSAHRRSRAGGARIVGHYHSHPTGLALPSARDAADAAPDGSVWLIVCAGAVTAWQAVEQGLVEGRFNPLTLCIGP